MKRYMVFNVGCIECGVSSDVVGIYESEEEAQKVAEVCQNELYWRENGKNSFEVYDLAKPQAQEYAEVLNVAQ